MVCEPVPGVNSRLKCRGQVIATHEDRDLRGDGEGLGYRPEPYCVADALMYADGKPIVEITNMSLRMSGLTRERAGDGFGPSRSRPSAVTSQPTPPRSTTPRSHPGLLQRQAVGGVRRAVPGLRLATASSPGCRGRRSSSSTASPRVDRRAVRAEGRGRVRGRVRRAAGRVVLRSEPLPRSCRSPCCWRSRCSRAAGWRRTAARRSTSADDLSFRNLGGKATQLRAGHARRRHARPQREDDQRVDSAGMIIQHYDMRVRDRRGDGLRGHDVLRLLHEGGAGEPGRHPRRRRCRGRPKPSVRGAERGVLPHDAPFPAPMLRMVDRIDGVRPRRRPEGARAGRRARSRSIPAFWFFKAHFYQDPVWPGSLGLESFLQLLKYAAWKRWGEPADRAAGRRSRSERAARLDLPRAGGADRQEVTVVLEVTAVDDAQPAADRRRFLTVDGRVIYQMTDFTLE